MKSVIKLFGLSFFLLMTSQSFKAFSNERDTLLVRQYFSHQDFGERLVNEMNSNFLVFEFPGKSAKDLYLRSLEILRDQEGKKELVENYSIDLYSCKIIPDTNFTIKFPYNYLLKFEDGKLIIENPYIGVNADIFTSELVTLNGYIAMIEEISRQDKARSLKIKRDQLRAILIKELRNGYSKTIGYLNCLTDSIVQGLSRKQLEDPSKWVVEYNKPSFELSVDGLSCNNGLNYATYKIPNANNERVKRMTEELVNFLQCDNPLEYSSRFLGSRYDFYAKRNISGQIIDMYFNPNTNLDATFSVAYKVGNYQKISVTKTIKVSKNVAGIMSYDMEITFADNLVRIKLPQIKEIKDCYASEYYNWLNKENTYKSMFSTPDNRVLHPDWKQAVEQYFNELFNFLSIFYSQNK